MTEYNTSNNQYRRAIEALRSGVPNRYAVVLMPPLQDDVEIQANKLLDINSIDSGLLISGGFGAGKSHALEYMKQLALEQRYVVSHVSVNKECPLGDINKIYQMAVESSEVSGKTGNAFHEIVHSYSPSKAPKHNELVKWLDSRSDIDPRFIAATLLLCDEALHAQLVDFLSGFNINVSELRRALKRNNCDYIRLGSPYKNMPRNRFEYLNMFFRAAGYNGWLLLIDEADMIASYSPISRLKAYNNMAWLYGIDRENNGLKTAISITNDFASVIIYGGVNDRALIPMRYANSVHDHLIPGAISGMEIIQTKCVEIELGQTFSCVYERLKDIYRQAYNWHPMDVDLLPDNNMTMRRHIRYCINQWDFLRLTGELVDIVSDENVYPPHIQVGDEIFEDTD